MFRKRWRRLILKWTAPKGLLAILLFFAFTLLVEYFLVRLFISFGLTERTPLIMSLQIPLTEFSLNLTISPLFHLIPLGVSVVLLSSWMHFTKYAVTMPRERKIAKRTLPPKRRKASRTWVDKKLRLMNRFFKRLRRRIGVAVIKIRGVSQLIQQLTFAKVAIQTAVIILALFLVSTIVLYGLGQPRLLYDVVVNLYRDNPSLHAFVLGTINTARDVARTLHPIGWIASSINNVLLSTAPGFRESLEGLGIIAKPLTDLDLTYKYVFCQNLAAWISAGISIAYGRYVAGLRHRRL